MSRIIKFRVWNIYKYKFLEYNGDYKYLLLSGDLYNIVDFSEVATRPDIFVVQQFTGLYDKNKKDIYEGDVIKSHTLIHQNKFIDRVEFRHGKFILSGMEYDLWDLHEDCEVIGNICENPELLNE